MSSINPTPNEFISPVPNTEVRLAYNVYTWDMDGMERQRTAWSTIGSYYYTSNADVMYTSNQNQLIKTAGSSGVAVVDNTLGIIANVVGKNNNSNYNDVSPIILYADATYIAGIDNNTVRNRFNQMHTQLNTIDLHFIETYNTLNSHSVSYTDLHGVTRFDSNYSELAATSMQDWIASTISNIGEIEENAYVALIGDSGGINKIENKGFIYNNLNYTRKYEVLNTWRNFYNYVGSWTYGSNAFSVTNFDNENLKFGSDVNTLNTITQVTDADITKLGKYMNEFEDLYEYMATSFSNSIDIKEASYYQQIASTISSIIDGIDIMLGNKAYDEDNHMYPLVSQAPIDANIFGYVQNVLNTYSSVSNVTDIWYSTYSAIAVDRIPWNSTFIDINENGTATGFAVVNDKTKTWQYTEFPTIDETWQRVMNYASKTDQGDGEHYESNISNYYNIINRFPITGNANGYSINSHITYITSNGGDMSAVVDLEDLDLGTSSNPSSFSYFLYENNLLNSANNFRFIGMKTESSGFYSNSEASNVVSITGFNKILLEDVYENPNNYQVPSFTWHWNDDKGDHSTANQMDVPVNEGISYSMSIVSALKTHGNFLVAGVGQDENSQNVGYNGVFYIPLPTEIQQNEDAQYQDTYWLLTTYTPNINNNATYQGIPNSGQVLYKYTKMNDFITTGVFGGFTPYYTTNKLTAGIVNIPQVSYSSNQYEVNNRVYVTEAENQAAKIGALTNNIVNVPPAINAIIASNPNFTAEITSNSDKCTIITLNSYEAAIIDQGGWMKNVDSNDKNVINNVMYLNLFGYDDGEYNNLTFDVNRKYIFTFNCHIQATNLNLVSDQINYGTPSLLLVGHFRQRYCKSTNAISGSHQVYPGETKLIPLLNKPLENPVNNIYNIDGTYTLSWNTTGDETHKALVQNYTFYIPDEYKSPFAITGSSFKEIYSNVFEIGSNGGDTVAPIIEGPTSQQLAGNKITFLNVLDRIYAFILVGENVNPNVKYQFVNNTTWQDDTKKVLSETDLELFAGVNIEDGKISINNQSTGIDGGILSVSEPMFSMTIQRY